FGLGFDGQYHNRFKNAVRDAIFAEGFNGNPNVSALASAAGGTGGSFASKAFNYFELHDDAWPLNGHERAVRDFDPVLPSNSDKARGLQTLGNGLVLTAKGVPAILQGTEWLEDDGWENNKIDWSHKAQNAGTIRFYQDLIALRTATPALFANSPSRTIHLNEGDDVFAFERWGTDGQSYVVVANISPFDRSGYTIGLPRSGEWGVIINNDATEYDGGGFGTVGSFQAEPIAYDNEDQRASLDIPAYGFMLLQHNPEFIGCSDADLAEPFGALNFFDISAFVASYSSGEASADLAAPFGTLNFFDVAEYVGLFNAGCP
ncbi:MAG: alpha amylase C-terminal domain-containing protein, partial [Planctomycetota bacterium]